MSNLGRLILLPKKFFSDVGAVVNAPSYYPELPRKCKSRRFFEVALSRLSCNWNPSYNRFGMDITGDGYWHCGGETFVYETHFWRRVIAQNYNRERPFNYAVIMRDKCLFWQFMKFYGISTPEVVAHCKRNHYFLGVNEVSFNDWINGWKEFEGSLFLKDDTNCCGRGVYKIMVEKGVLSIPQNISLKQEFFQNKDFILQRGINNHPEIDKIYPKSLNTARLITVWNERQNRPMLFTQFYRCGANGNSVDNWAAGGLLLHLDADGRLGEYGYFKSREYAGSAGAMRVTSHPETGFVFKGAKLTDYAKGLALCLRAHSMLPNLKSIGWDVAFTENGPTLIEGNEDWEISPAQMVNGGLAAETKKYFGV